MNKRIRENTWVEEPKNIDFPMDCEPERKPAIKLIAKRRYYAIVCKWMLEHRAEPFNVTKIAEGSGVNAGTVSGIVKKLGALGIVNLHRVESLDKKEKLYSINQKAAELIVKRYLWLSSFQLLKALPKEEDTLGLDELRENSEFNQVMSKHRLSFQEAVESLGSNSFIELLEDRAGEPYAIKLKENLPLEYFKQVEKSEVEAVE